MFGIFGFHTWDSLRGSQFIIQLRDSTGYCVAYEAFRKRDEEILVPDPWEKNEAGARDYAKSQWAHLLLPEERPF